MVDILDEISSDLRHERFYKIWQHGAKLYIILAILVVIGSSIFLGWRHYHNNQVMEESDRLYTVISNSIYSDPNSNNKEKTLDDLNKILKDASVTKPLIQLKQAQLYLAQNQVQAAVNLYDNIANNRSYPDLMRDLAKLYALYVKIDNKLVSNDKIEKELNYLARPNSAFRFSAQELQLDLAYQQKNVAKQKQIIESIAADPIAPASLQQRVNKLQLLLVPSTASAKKEEPNQIVPSNTSTLSN